MIGATLLYMAVFGAMISYCMPGTVVHPAATQAAEHRAARIAARSAFRARRPPGDRARDARAIICRIRSTAPASIGVLAWYVLGVLYFAFIGRHKLVLSPEEEFAMTGGQHGHPEREGYGRTSVEGVSEAEPPVPPEPPAAPSAA